MVKDSLRTKELKNEKRDHAYSQGVWQSFCNVLEIGTMEFQKLVIKFF